MPSMSFTSFVDIAAKVGTRKITAIANVKNKNPYHPAFDHYKIVRDHIAEIHQKGANKNQLKTAQQLTSDPKRIPNYGLILNAYKHFWGRKSIQWFDPPRSVWSSNSVDITVNPELGLIINGTPHSIKLYFKADKLSKSKVDLSLFLMHQSLTNKYNGNNIVHSILDIRNNHLYTPTAFNPNITHALNAEAAYINSIWPNI